VAAKRSARKNTPAFSPAQLESPDTLSPEELAARRARMDSETAERNRRQGYDLLAEGARLLGQRRPGEAATQLERAATLLPDNADVAINLAGAYVLQRRYALAVSTLERAKDLAPTNPMIWVNLAAAYLGRLEISGPQQQDRAIAAYERALELDPHAPNVHYNLGLIYKDRKDWQRAQGEFRLALETDPGDSDAHYWLDQIASMAVEDEP
jgi:tetratricopeptide (TPR) repeat protein